MANIFNLPDFMFLNVDRSNLTKLQKLIFFIKGIFISSIHKRANGKLFCFIMNLFYSEDGKIYYESEKYYKQTLDGSKMYFPNKRVDRVILSKNGQLEDLLDQYSLNEFRLGPEDIVIDCGSNVGELYLGLKMSNHKFKYIGFEPDPEAFECLKLNLSQFDVQLFNVALSNKNESVKFYLDTHGANSSIDYFGEEKNIYIDSKKLDSYFYKKIKLIKLEAEGHELEILEGAIKTLMNTEFVSVDYGPEKGKYGKMTLPGVTNYLYSNGFNIESASSKRYTALFKNSKYE